MDCPFSPSGSSSTKSKNKLKKEKRNLSYADLHSEVKNDVNIKPPSSRLCQKQHIRSRGLHNEELVKYMSKLPSYLEKGEQFKGKPLNLGVLDWRSLENWQNYQPQIPSCRYSISSSIASSSSWTDGSSNRYGRGETFTLDGHKERRPSLQSYLNIPPVGHFEHAESVARNATNRTDIEAVPSNPFDGQQNILRESLFSTTSSDTTLKECNKEHLDLQNISKTRSFKYVNSHEVLSSSKGKLKVQGNASTKESEELQNRCGHGIHASPDRHRDVLLMPRDSAESIKSCPTNLIERNGQELKEFSATSSEGFHFGEVYHTELYPSVSDSCSLTHEIDDIEESQKEQNFSCSPSSALKSVSRATTKILKEKSSSMPVNSTSSKSLKGLNMKMRRGSDSEVQNPSPSRRLSFVLNRIGRSYNSRASSAVPRHTSEDVTAKSVVERADSFVCRNNATIDQSKAVNRDHSSPLKRLLDPLLKFKVTNSRFADQSQKNSTSSRRASASFDEGKFSTVNPVKVKLDLPNLRATQLDEACHSKIWGSETVQAYFQVAAKNDLPLFTFAVDNNSDVLAATLRMFSSVKNDPTWIYTFFSIHETKRKSGIWLSQGSKGKDYVPNVVAQMKVTDLPFSNLGEHVTIDQLITRKFLLYPVDLRPFDYQTCDMQPNNELAAIVVKFPKRIVTCLKDSSVDVRGSSNSRDLQDDKFSIGSQKLSSTTVVLPNGVHGLPCKGEPTPLIERWLSGGQCDCGGWDMGCKVKVLGNKNQKPDGQFQLFSQSQEEAKKTTFFTLSSLKNGIFLVEFNSTLSLLQAFSICVAVFDSMQPSDRQQPSELFQEKLSEDTTLLDSCGLKTSNQVGVDVPARFVSHPPHSPVGRV